MRQLNPAKQSNRNTPMQISDYRKFYIHGQWVDPLSAHDITVINPATEEPIASVSLGSSKDVGEAVESARKAFMHYSETTREERLEVLKRVIDRYKAKSEQL